MPKDKNDKKDKPAKKMEIEDIYKKKDPITHILDLPDTYVGSIEMDTKRMWIYDDDDERMIEKEVTFSPAFLKICDEILVNASDHQVLEKSCKTIKVITDEENGCISVYNDGKGIPVVIHKEHNCYVPELIFGQLMTSSNYDQKGKITGGKNGLGSKVVSVLSKRFIVETVDAERHKKYVQEFFNNMREKKEPKITDVSKDTNGYTKITFYPDFKRFGMDGLDDDSLGLIKKRVYDIAAYTRENVKVYLNDEQLKVKTFEDFIKLHYKEPPILVYEEISDRWKVGVVFDRNDGGNQVSFVNGIWTYNGGTHVDYISGQITKKLKEMIAKKNKGLVIKPAQITEHLTIFISSVINDPAFSSQTKGELTSKVSNFGSTCIIDEVFIKKLSDTGLTELVTEFAKMKEASGLKTTDGRKGASVRDIPKLDDAHWAGSRKSKETRLILTEGDSAKSFAIAGVEVLGRERYGVFPLKGKPINVRDIAISKIKSNDEFNNIKRILGLQTGVKYTTENLGKLRYGGIVILTDQDADGSHIKGLVINMISVFWPELLTIKGFIQTMSTPLIKAFKKSDKKKANPVIFYSLSEYEQWAEENDVGKWHIKYYKGLGTSDNKEAKQLFRDFENRIINYVWDVADKAANKKGSKSSSESDSSDSESEKSSESESEDDKETKSNGSKQSGKSVKKEKEIKNTRNNIISDAIRESKSFDALTLAFAKDRADDRKKWLYKHNKDIVLEYDNQNVSFSDFVNKDLIHFSALDVQRSIPSIIDGFKPSQRKIMFACFKKKQNTEIKVAQLASYVAEHTAYKHGEESMEKAIVGMGQRFPGSNNIYLLHPSGQFGNRRLWGEDHASSRYIFTYIDPITRKIFIEQDETILKYQEDEGESIEPEYYLPIIPMILVNGSKGIGTGFSTTIPQYNPIDICNNIMRKMDGKDLVDMDPWYHGFTGKIQKIKDGKDKGKYKVSGKFKVNANTVTITEIPVAGQNCALEKYEEVLKSLCEGAQEKKKNTKNTKGKKVKTVKAKKVQLLTDYKSNCGLNSANFTVEFKNGELQKFVKKGNDDLEKYLRLSTNMAVSNLHLYNTKGVVTKYNSPLDIIEEFYNFRLTMYEVRRKHHLKILNNELQILKYKVKFVKEVIDEDIIIAKKKKDEIIKKLEKKGYPKLSHNIDATEDEKTYRYVTDMQLFSLTEEKIDELNKEYKNKQKEYDEYNSTTAIELWRKELNDLITFYAEWLKDRIEEENDDDIADDKKKKGGKKVTKRVSKKKESKKDDGDDIKTKKKSSDKSSKSTKSKSKEK